MIYLQGYYKNVAVKFFFPYPKKNPKTKLKLIKLCFWNHNNIHPANYAFKGAFSATTFPL